ncbi:hypothetical protein Ccrd_001264, partial [Cynara cardunculus var. scolymus]
MYLYALRSHMFILLQFFTKLFYIYHFYEQVIFHAYIFSFVILS